jgi:16S rRNA (adenine1518-N6/adenine1519-N6)-dimethyltransferase
MQSPKQQLIEAGILAKKQLGQNFLNTSKISEMIVDRSGVGENDVLVEIGAGLGALTLPLSRRVKKVYAIETDARLIPLLQENIDRFARANVSIVHADIMSVDLVRLAGEAGAVLHVFGNLPYNISSQVLIKLMNERRAVKQGVVMLQKELVTRILADHGSRDYGRLSVMMQYAAAISELAEIKAVHFFPAPKVDSAVISIQFYDRLPYPAENEPLFQRVVKAAFGQRRKTLRNALAGGGIGLAPQDAETVLKGAGIDPMRRAESLNVEEFVRLSNFIHARGA